MQHHMSQENETDQDQQTKAEVAIQTKEQDVTILDPARDILDSPEFDRPQPLFPEEVGWEGDQLAPYAPELSPFENDVRELKERLAKTEESKLIDSVQQDYVLFIIRRTACVMLDIICSGDVSTKVMGARALILQHELKAGPFRNQTEIARRLKISNGRVSQLLNYARAAINRIYNENCKPPGSKIKLPV